MPPKGIDMSLDDIIRSKERNGGQYSHLQSGRGDNSGLGPDRRQAHRNPNRTTPYTSRQSEWRQQMVWSGGSNPDADAGTKLYISNLDYDVSDDDIQVIARYNFDLVSRVVRNILPLLFSDIGELKSYSINYDRSGRSKGTAEVVFWNQKDALAAINRYNNVKLDGKRVKIEVVGANLIAPALAPLNRDSIMGKTNFAFRSEQGMVNARGGGGRGYGRDHGQGKDRQRPTVADLDADLEKYKMEATKAVI